MKPGFLYSGSKGVDELASANIKQVLFYVESWGTGGIENFIMNTIRSSAEKKIQFDIFCTHDSNDTYDSDIRSFGGKRYTVFKDRKPGLLRRLLCSAAAWSKLLREKHYDVVHINTMNGTGFIYAAIAARSGVSTRVVHSHNSAFGHGHFAVKFLMHNICKFIFSWGSNVRLACSEPAGKYLFGRNHFTIIPNGVDTRRFQFDPVSRAQMRKRLDVSNTDLLFGAVGRLADAKNPLFQIDILKELRQRGVQAILVLVGSGPLLKEVQEYSRKCKMDSYVILPGETAEPQEFYSALDVVSMPSRFEGFPMALVEAASSGVPCVVSYAIPKFAFPISNIIYRSEKKFTASMWASAIYSQFSQRDLEKRKESAEIMRDNGFDGESLAEKISTQYILPKDR